MPESVSGAPIAVDGLTLILRSERDAYEGMNALSERMREAIIRNDHKTVLTVTQEQRVLMESIQEMERKRERVTERIAAVSGADGSVINIWDIAAMAQESQGMRLREAGEALRAAVERQRALNDVNMTLIKTTIDVTQSVITALTEADTLNNMYTSGGEQSRPVYNNKRDFFNREI